MYSSYVSLRGVSAVKERQVVKWMTTNVMGYASYKKAHKKKSMDLLLEAEKK